jgi:hypothetical protein
MLHKIILHSSYLTVVFKMFGRNNLFLNLAQILFSYYKINILSLVAYKKAK